MNTWVTARHSSVRSYGVFPNSNHLIFESKLMFFCQIWQKFPHRASNCFWEWNGWTKWKHIASGLGWLQCEDFILRLNEIVKGSFFGFALLSMKYVTNGSMIFIKCSSFCWFIRVIDDGKLELCFRILNITCISVMKLKVWLLQLHFWCLVNWTQTLTGKSDITESFQCVCSASQNFASAQKQ